MTQAGHFLLSGKREEGKGPREGVTSSRVITIRLK